MGEDSAGRGNMSVNNENTHEPVPGVEGGWLPGKWGWWSGTKLVGEEKAKASRGLLSRASYNQPGLCPAGLK